MGGHDCVGGLQRPVHSLPAQPYQSNHPAIACAHRRASQARGDAYHSLRHLDAALTAWLAAWRLSKQKQSQALFLLAGHSQAQLHIVMRAWASAAAEARQQHDKLTRWAPSWCPGALRCFSRQSYAVYVLRAAQPLRLKLTHWLGGLHFLRCRAALYCLASSQRSTFQAWRQQAECKARLREGQVSAHHSLPWCKHLAWGSIFWVAPFSDSNAT